MPRPAPPKNEFEGRVPRRQPTVRSAVYRFLVAGLLVLVVVATPVVLWIRAVAEDHALDNAIDMTQRLADYAIGPLVTENLLAAEPEALRSMEERLAPWVDDEAIRRIKVWTADGRIVYSDQTELIGQTFELEDWAEQLLGGGPATASIESQLELENEFESHEGELVEVYVASSSVTGQPLIFEAYFDDDVVRREQASVLLTTAPTILLALVALQAAQLFPAIQLARRVQSHQLDRRRLLQHAVDAGELERSRLARDLHDDVIQELSGLSYALEADDITAHGGNVGVVSPPHAILRNSIRTLRGITSSLYSPTLDGDALPEAIAALTDSLAASGTGVTLNVPVIKVLSNERATMFHRVAREAIANAAKHAGASNVDVSLAATGGNTVLTVHDDGVGFDPHTESPRGHLGLRIMRDIAAAADGTLEVRSEPGRGTTVTATVANDAAGRPAVVPVSAPN